MLSLKEKDRRLIILFDLEQQARAEGKPELAAVLQERRKKLNIQPTLIETWVEV